jgi:hypothetical protein
MIWFIVSIIILLFAVIALLGANIYYYSILRRNRIPTHGEATAMYALNIVFLFIALIALFLAFLALFTYDRGTSKETERLIAEGVLTPVTDQGPENASGGEARVIPIVAIENPAAAASFTPVAVAPVAPSATCICPRCPPCPTVPLASEILARSSAPNGVIPIWPRET